MSVENSHIILCDKCQSKFDVTLYKPGQKLRCSECKNVMLVPPREIVAEHSPITPPEAVAPFFPPEAVAPFSPPEPSLSTKIEAEESAPLPEKQDASVKVEGSEPPLSPPISVLEEQPSLEKKQEAEPPVPEESKPPSDLQKESPVILSTAENKEVQSTQEKKEGTEAKPEEPSTKLEEPSTKLEEPSTKPEEPSTKPEEPSTKPEELLNLAVAQQMAPTEEKEASESKSTERLKLKKALSSEEEGTSGRIKVADISQTSGRIKADAPDIQTSRIHTIPPKVEILPSAVATSPEPLEEEIPQLPLPIKLGAKAVEILKQKGTLDQLPATLLASIVQEKSSEENQPLSSPKKNAKKRFFPEEIILPPDLFKNLSRFLDLPEKKLSKSLYGSLGLKALESDPEKIQKKIRIVLKKLKAVQEDSAYASCHQYVLSLQNVLEDPEKKKKYDEDLRQRLAPEEEENSDSSNQNVGSEKSPQKRKEVVVDERKETPKKESEKLSPNTKMDAKTEAKVEKTPKKGEDEKKTLKKNKDETDEAPKIVEIKKKTERLSPKKEKKEEAPSAEEKKETPSAKPERKRTERVKKTDAPRSTSRQKKPFFLFVLIGGVLLAGGLIWKFTSDNTAEVKPKMTLWQEYQNVIEQLEEKGSLENYKDPALFIQNHFKIALWCQEYQPEEPRLKEKYEIHLKQVVLALSKYPQFVKKDPWTYKEAWQFFGYKFDPEDNLWKTESDLNKKPDNNFVKEILGDEIVSLQSDLFDLYCQEGSWFSGSFYLEAFLPRMTKVYEEIATKHPEVRNRKEKLRILIFANPKKYQEYAARHRPEAADESGIYFPDDSLLVILREKIEHGEDTFWNKNLFHPGNFYEVILSKTSGTPSVITKAEISAAEVLGENVAKYRTQHYFVAVQFSNKYNAQQKAVEAGAAFEELYRNFYLEMRKFFPELKDVNRLMPYFIFKDQNEYIEYGKKKKDKSAEYAGGHYEPDKRRMMTFYTQGDEKGWGQEVIFHEGTHQLMHFIAEYHSSPMMWFSEGVADYIAGFRVLPGGKYEVAKVNRRRNMEYQMLLKQAPQALMSTKELLDFSYGKREAIFSSTKNTREEKEFLFGRVYYQAWVTVYYFLKGPNTEHREKFLEYFKAELKGEGGLNKAREIFGKLDLEAMDAEIKKFAGDLKMD